MTAPAVLIDNYLAGIDTLRNAIAGLTPEQIRARPIPDKWSTLECVCHLVDFDPIYADRMKRVIAEDKPDLISADENRFAATLAYQERNLDEELSILENTRRQMARILRTLPESAWSRTGTYRMADKEETRTLERLLTLVTNHISHHVEFIRKKRQALGLPAA